MRHCTALKFSNHRHFHTTVGVLHPTWLHEALIRSATIARGKPRKERDTPRTPTALSFPEVSGSRSERGHGSVATIGEIWGGKGSKQGKRSRVDAAGRAPRSRVASRPTSPSCQLRQVLTISIGHRRKGATLLGHLAEGRRLSRPKGFSSEHSR
jgi:hypothetical protein